LSIRVYAAAVIFTSSFRPITITDEITRHSGKLIGASYGFVVQGSVDTICTGIGTGILTSVYFTIAVIICASDGSSTTDSLSVLGRHDTSFPFGITFLVTVNGKVVTRSGAG